MSNLNKTNTDRTAQAETFVDKFATDESFWGGFGWHVHFIGRKMQASCRSVLVANIAERMDATDYPTN